MPKKAEKRMRATAKARGYGKDKADAYVYGGLRNMGWKPARAKGKRKKGKR